MIKAEKDEIYQCGVFVGGTLKIVVGDDIEAKVKAFMYDAVTDTLLRLQACKVVVDEAGGQLLFEEGPEALKIVAGKIGGKSS